MNTTLPCLRLLRRSEMCARVGLLFLMAAATVSAADKTWDGGGEDNNWQTGFNWNANTAPAPGDTLIFTGTVRLNTTNNFVSLTGFDGLSFNGPAGAFSLRGNAISLDGDISDNQPILTQTISLPMTLSGNRNVNVGADASLTIGGVVSGGFGLSKSGAGLLTLAGANLYSGATRVNAGTLSISSDGNLGAVPGAATPGSLVLSNGTLRSTTSFALNANRGIALGPTSGSGAATILVPVAHALTYGGIIANNGGSGGLNKAGFGVLALGGANTYTGPTTVKNGTLTLNFNQAGAPADNIIASSSPLVLGGENSGIGTTNHSTLLMQGNAGAVNSQTFNGTTIDLGSQVIRANGGAGGTANLNLGEINPLRFGDVTFIPPALTGGSGHINTTTTNVNGILGGWALIGDGSLLNGMSLATNWASVDGSGNIVNFSNHIVYNSAWGKIRGNVTAADNLLIDDTSGAATTVAFDDEGAGTLTEVNTINIRRSAAWTLRIGSNNVVRLGKYGSIFKSDTTTHAMVVGFGDGGTRAIAGAQDQGGILTAGGADNTPGVIVFNFNQGNQGDANHQMVMAKITDNGTAPVTVVKVGSGPLNLGGHNTHSGGTYMLQGRVQAGGGFVGTINPDAYGSGPIYVLPGCYLYLNPAPPGGTIATITNDLFLAGNGTQTEALGSIRFQNAGWEIASTVTLIGDATIGGNNGRPGITGRITGPFTLTMGSGATVAGVVRYANPANDWTGGTVMQSRNTGANAVESGASEIIPHGFDKGNVTMSGIAGGTITWNLNGFSETINGLATTGNGASCIIVNNGTDPSTLTVGDNDQSGTFAGAIQDGGGTLALTKIGRGELTLSAANGYTGPTIVNGGTLALSGSGTINNSASITVDADAVLDVSGVAAFAPTGPVTVTNGRLIARQTGPGMASLTLNNARVQVATLSETIPNVETTSLTGSGTISIDVLSIGAVSSYPATFPILRYGSLNGAGFNFVLGDAPGTSTAGHIVTNAGTSTIELVLTDGPKPLTWTGATDNTWQIGGPNNWLAFGITPAPFQDFDVARFDDSASVNTVNLTASVIPGALVVDNPTKDYTIEGTGGISGFAGLAKSGGGKLTLANTGPTAFSGGVEVNGGTVVFASDNTISGGLTLAFGTTVEVGVNGGAGTLPGGPVANEGGLVFNRGADLTVANVIGGSGTLTKSAAGVLSLNGANTAFEGPITVNAGTLRAGSGSALGTATGNTTIAGGATLDVGGQQLNLEPVTVGGAGVGGLGAIINSGADNINALGNVTLTAHTTFGGTGRWDIRNVGGAGASLNTEPPGSAYNLTKIGANQVSLVGVLTDAALGNIDVQAGVFAVETTSSLGNPAATLTVAAGATLQFFNNNETPIDKTLVLNGDGVANTINNASGANTINSAITLGGDARFNVGGTSLTIASGLTGGGSLTKIGGATLFLNGANTYAGTTTVSGGTLVLNGSKSGAATMTVAAGGTLAGRGSHPGAVTVNGTVSPGFGDQPAGTLTTGPLTLSGAQFNAHLAHSDHNGITTHDRLTVTGALTLEGVTTINLTAAAVGTLTNGQLVTLVTYTGARTGGAANLALGVIPQGYTLTLLDPDTTPGSIQLRVDNAPRELEWRGGVAGNPTAWDTAGTLNWFNPATTLAAGFANGDVATFGDTANTNRATLVGDLSPNSITMNNFSLNYTFDGSGRLRGNARLDLQGAGQLVIANSGSNDFTGSVNVTSGTLQIGAGGEAGNLGSGNITNQGNLVFNRAGELTVNNIHGFGLLTNLGSGVVTIGGANTYDGNVTVVAGTLRAGSGSALGSVFGQTEVLSGATLDVGGQQLNNETVIVSGAGVGGAGVIVNTGLDNINALGNVTLADHATFGGTGRWDIRGGVATLSTLGQPINLTKVGPNQISLVGVSVDFGLSDIIVQAGTFSYETTTTGLGDPSKLLSVAAGATFQMFNITTPADKVFQFTGDGVVNTVNVPSGTGNAIVGPVTLTGPCLFNVTAANVLSIFSNVDGTGGLAKNGTGTLNLSGLLTYTGNTTVNDGTLALTFPAELVNSPVITVGTDAVLDLQGGTLALASGQTLQGHGTINGSVTAAAGATVAPGTSAGVLTVNNDVTLQGTTVMEVASSPLTNDRLRSVAGTITYGGTLVITNLGSLTGTNTYQLFEGTLAGNFANVSVPTLTGVTWDTSQLTVNGTITVRAPADVLPPPTLGFGLTASGLEISWSPDYAGWTLEGQTNSVTVGLSGNWAPVAGSSGTNRVFVPVNPANGSAFYRLVP